LFLAIIQNRMGKSYSFFVEGTNGMLTAGWPSGVIPAPLFSLIHILKKFTHANFKSPDKCQDILKTCFHMLR